MSCRAKARPPRTHSDRALARLELVMALVAQADAGSTARAARIAEARDILTSSPAEAFTTPSAFSAVTVDAFLQTRASLARRLGVTGSARSP